MVDNIQKETTLESFLNKEDDVPRCLCPKGKEGALYQDLTRGELICTNCGMVIGEHQIDRKREWRAYTPEEEEARSRIGPFAKKGSRLTTKIGHHLTDWTDAKGAKIPVEKRLPLYRQRRQHFSISFSGMKSTQIGHDILDRLKTELGINQVTLEAASNIYEYLIKKRVSRGRRLEDLVLFSLVHASKIRGTQTLIHEEIKEALGGYEKTAARKTSVFDIYKVLHSKHALQKLMEFDMKHGSGILQPEDYLPRVSTKLNETEAKRRLTPLEIMGVREVIYLAKQGKFYQGKCKTGITGASMYIFSGVMSLFSNDYKLTQRSIADAAEVTEVTIRNLFKGILKEVTNDVIWEHLMSQFVPESVDMINGKKAAREALEKVILRPLEYIVEQNVGGDPFEGSFGKKLKEYSQRMKNKEVIDSFLGDKKEFFWPVIRDICEIDAKKDPSVLSPDYISGAASVAFDLLSDLPRRSYVVDSLGGNYLKMYENMRGMRQNNDLQQFMKEKWDAELFYPELSFI
jgi:transcription initiation factor TFIIB